MNPKIKSIIHTPENRPIDIMAMKWVVEQYIREKKGRDIQISIRGSFFSLNTQIQKLINAYEYARAYYIETYGS